MFGEDGKVVGVILLEDLELRLDHQWAEMCQRKSSIGEVFTQRTVRSQDSERQFPTRPRVPSVLTLSEQFLRVSEGIILYFFPLLL